MLEISLFLQFFLRHPVHMLNFPLEYSGSSILHYISMILNWCTQSTYIWKCDLKPLGKLANENKTWKDIYILNPLQLNITDNSGSHTVHMGFISFWFELVYILIFNNIWFYSSIFHLFTEYQYGRSELEALSSIFLKVPKSKLD